MTFAGLVCIEKQKNSLDLLSTIKKWWIHICTSQRCYTTALLYITNLLHNGKYFSYSVSRMFVYKRKQNMFVPGVSAPGPTNNST